MGEVTREMINICARSDDLERLKMYEEDNFQITKISNDVMSHAAEGGSLDIVIYLESLGADINARRPGDLTPLMNAAYRGFLPVVEYLVARGADLDLADEAGYTALHYSAKRGKYETMTFLLKAGANCEPFPDSEDVWDMLIEHLVDEAVHPKDIFDWHTSVPCRHSPQFRLIEPLRMLVLKRDTHPDQENFLVDELLEPVPRNVMIQGIRLHDRFPDYSRHRQAVLRSRWTSINRLPPELCALIFSFDGPFSTEEIWATGLGGDPSSDTFESCYYSR